MKRKEQIVKILIFVCLLTLPWVIWYFPGKPGKSLRKNYSYELKENRNIYDLNDGVENAYNDRIPFRSFLITEYQNVNQSMDKVYKKGPQRKLIALLYTEDPSASAKKSGVDEAEFEWLLGKEDETMMEEDHIHDYVISEIVDPSFDNFGYTVYTCSYCGDEIKKDFVDKMIDDTFLPPDMSDTFVVTGRSDWLFLFDYLHMYDLYQGKNLLDDEKLEQRCSTYALFAKECEKRGIKVGLLIAPAKYQVYDEYMPSLEIESEEKQMDKIVDYVRKNSEVPIAYPRKELDYADRYYQTYFRYDSHWNQVGGYIGVMSLYKEMGLDVTPMRSVEITRAKKKPTQCVDLFGMIGRDYSDFEHKDYNYKVKYKPDVKATNTPTTPIYEMEPIQEMTSDADNDLHFVLMGDSFRAQLAPYVAKDFKKTTFIDKNVYAREAMESAGYNYEELMNRLIEDVHDADYLVLELTEANEDYMMDFVIDLLYIVDEMDVTVQVDEPAEETTEEVVEE